MWFWWVIIYAITILAAKHLSPFSPWVMPVSLFLYVAALIVWLRAKRPDVIPFKRITLLQAKEQLLFLPYLIPLLCRLGNEGMPSHSVATVLEICCAVVLEEVVFRGVLLRYLCQKWRRGAVIVAALLFAVMHLVNLEYQNVIFVLHQVLFAFAAGIALGSVSLLCRSLIPAIGIHLLINLTAVNSVGTLLYWILVAVFLLMGLHNIALLNKKGNTYETVY